MLNQILKPTCNSLKQTICIQLRVGISSVLGLLMMATLANAQNPNMIYGGQPRTLSTSSWQYRAPMPARKIKLNDLVTVLVNETQSILIEGEVDRRKTGKYESVIEDWANIKKGELKPTQQNQGDPKIAGSTTQNYRTDSSLETTGRVQFSITCRVVGIRPNGNLVLFGRRHKTLYGEKIHTYISGIVRTDDINSSNTILSEKMADFSVTQGQKGQVRDGWRRGWATRIIDVINPF